MCIWSTTVRNNSSSGNEKNKYYSFFINSICRHIPFCTNKVWDVRPVLSHNSHQGPTNVSPPTMPTLPLMALVTMFASHLSFFEGYKSNMDWRPLTSPDSLQGPAPALTHSPIPPHPMWSCWFTRPPLPPSIKDPDRPPPMSRTTQVTWIGDPRCLPTPTSALYQYLPFPPYPMWLRWITKPPLPPLTKDPDRLPLSVTIYTRPSSKPTIPSLHNIKQTSPP